MLIEKPNILLVVIDCLRADRAFGPDRSAQTPNLHALAQSGVLFDTLITANSMTIPCMTTMFSGLYPQRHGVRAMVGSRVADEIPLLAEVLRGAGYNTYAEATGPLNAFYRLDRGFEHYAVRDGVKDSFLGAWGDEFIGRFAQQEFKPPWFVYVHLWGVHRPRQIRPDMNSADFGKTQYDRAISSYDARLGDLLAQINPADTITLVTGDHGEKIPENELESQVEFLKKSLTSSAAKKPNSPFIRFRRKSIAMAREAWVSGARLMHRVGLTDSPLASVTGHGYHVYDSLVRVPLVVSGSSQLPEGLIISDQVRQVDIMPTILELAGLGAATPEGIDGQSLVALMSGEAAGSSLPAFIETCQNSREPSSFYGVRHDGWKYAFDAENPKVPAELYELATNPDENHNLIKEQPERAAYLQGLILAHLEQERQAGSALADELSDDEMAGLAEHLKKLGYVE